MSQGDPASGSSWLPAWLAIVVAVVFVIVAAVHLRRMGTEHVRLRVWHFVHVLMALGMVALFLPVGRMLVSPREGGVAFGVLGVGGLAYAVTMFLRRDRAGWLWLIVAVDAAALAYLFVVSPNAPQLLTVVVVAWLVLQATGWLSGRLTQVHQQGTADMTQPAGLRLPLAATSVGMAYMLLALQFGASEMGKPPAVALPAPSNPQPAPSNPQPAPNNQPASPQAPVPSPALPISPEPPAPQPATAGPAVAEAAPAPLQAPSASTPAPASAAPSRSTSHESTSDTPAPGKYGSSSMRIKPASYVKSTPPGAAPSGTPTSGHSKKHVERRFPR